MPRLTLSLEDLELFPELTGDRFPYRGYRDFRGMKDEDYAEFSAGVFQRVGSDLTLLDPGTSEDPFKDFNCKWFGGKDRFLQALGRLVDCGYECLCIPPSDAEDQRHWYVIRFRKP